MFCKVNYVFRGLQKESEIRVVGMDPKSQKLIIGRNGLPQGLPISPLIATLALELRDMPKGLIMYADDGIFVGDNQDEYFD